MACPGFDLLPAKVCISLLLISAIIREDKYRKADIFHVLAECFWREVFNSLNSFVDGVRLRLEFDAIGAVHLLEASDVANLNGWFARIQWREKPDSTINRPRGS